MSAGGVLGRASWGARRLVAMAPLVACVVVLAGTGVASASSVRLIAQQATTVPSFTDPLAIQSVSCPSSTLCVGVGSSATTTGRHVPIVENWVNGQWSISVPLTPSAPPDVSPQAVSCISSTCVAVGQTFSAGTVNGLFAMTLTSGSWSQSDLTSTLPVGVQNATFSSISCADATDCTAVGSYVDGSGNFAPLVETLSGGSWASAPASTYESANFSQAQLTSVSCPTASTCVAVGFDLDSTSIANAITATASSGYVINQIADIPNIDPIKDPLSPTQELLSVSCVDATDCVAVGNYQGDGFSDTVSGSGAFVSTLAAGVWTSALIPDPGTTSVSGLSIQCFSVGNCVATGDATTYNSDGSATLSWATESLSAGAWSTSVVGAPSSVQLVQGQLQSLSCSTATDCQAVGWDLGSPQSFALGEVAGVWQPVVVLPGYSPPPYAAMVAVSCVTIQRCVGVGTVLRDRVLASPMMAVRANGVWGSTAPTLSTSETGQLLGVSCVSSTFCAAVGRDTVGVTNSPLVAIFNGSTWTTSTITSPQWGGNGHLSAISCSSSSFCAAIGTVDRPKGFDPVVAAIWNGVMWRSVSLPQASSVGVQPHVSIACPAPGRCVAAVSALAAHANQTLLETLYAGVWRLTVLPQPAEPSLMINAIACPDVLHCTAAGRIATRPVVDSLVGTVWTQTALNVVSSVAPASLTGVSCKGATSCIAVGTLRLVTGAQKPFFAQMVANKWVVPATSFVIQPPGTSMALSSVSCATAKQCTAVGFADNGVTRLPLSVDVSVR